MRTLLAMLSLIASIALAWPADAAEPWPICHGGHRVTCVVDGDTFWLEGEKIRPEGFDAPESGPPSCPGPATGARAATEALARVLGSGEVRIVGRDGRSYDRTLARVTVGGRDLARLMLATGTVRPYVPGEAPWC